MRLKKDLLDLNIDAPYHSGMHQRAWKKADSQQKVMSGVMELQFGRCSTMERRSHILMWTMEK